MTTYIVKNTSGHMLAINGYGDHHWTSNPDVAFWFLTKHDASLLICKFGYRDAGVSVEPVTVR